MSKKIKVGMIGYGFMGKAHSNAYRQASRFFPDLPYQPELKVFCARNEERAKQFANNWGYDQVETDWRKVVESKDVDLIDICAPNNMHKEIAVAAALTHQCVPQTVALEQCGRFVTVRENSRALVRRAPR